MKVDILAIGVHPDDIELSCSGTIINAVRQGKKVGILDLTEGELGTRGSAELRKKEAQAAANIMGVSERFILNMGDGFFQHNEANVREIAKYVRYFQPEIVLANAVSDRHPDHGRAGKLISDACFYSGLRKIETQWDGVNQEAHRPRQVYHYIQDYYMKPDVIVDISDAWDDKVKSIMAYSSQFYNPESEEPVTPISSKAFMEFLEGRSAQFGRLIHAERGEGFTVSRPIGVKQINELL